MSQPSDLTPTASKIHSLFHPMSIQGQQKHLLALISDTVSWTILGHSPMSGHYTSKTDFITNTLKPLGEKVLTEPLRLEVTNVVGTLSGVEGNRDGDLNGEVAVELKAIDAVCKNGLVYDMTYVWVCTFEKGKIVRVRAYLDTDLLSRAMEQNP